MLLRCPPVSRVSVWPSLKKLNMACRSKSSLKSLNMSKSRDILSMSEMHASLTARGAIAGLMPLDFIMIGLMWRFCSNVFGLVLAIISSKSSSWTYCGWCTNVLFSVEPWSISVVFHAITSGMYIMSGSRAKILAGLALSKLPTF